MSEIPEVPSQSQGNGSDEDPLLNTAISIAVALAGTFMALCNVKAGNVSQAMQDAQSRRVNEWSYYQAKSTKQNLAEGTVEQLKSLRALSGGAAPEAVAELDRKIVDFQKKVERYEREKEEIKRNAEGHQNQYETLNKVDDQLDLSDAAISVGIALSGVSALVRRRSLFAAALVFLGVGTVMGLAGFFGWGIELAFLSRWLSI
jgi:hypothetical protein